MKKVIGIILLAAVIADLLWGNVWQLIISGNTSGAKEILYLFRIPRVINSLSAGAGLALVGLVLQTILHNPLAGPYVLGISSGSAMGVAIALMMMGSAVGVLSFMSVYVFALAGAIGVIVVLLVLARHYSMVAVIIAGVLLAGIFSAMVSVLQFFSPAYTVKNFVVWTMASVDVSNYNVIITNLVVVVGSIIFVLMRTTVLDSFYLGEDYALSMGVDVRKQRTVFIVTAGIIIALLTASYGPIAFVGVTSPHIARWVSQSQRHSQLVIYSSLSGSAFVVVADFISHVMPVVLPINSVLSLMGIPVLLVLILKREYDFF